MAGAKKKKTKPGANSARGFATTSIASKPRAENTESSLATTSDVPTAKTPGAKPGASPSSATQDAKSQSDDTKTPSQQTKELSAEEFEKQLEESELQLLVEKHAQKVKRDSQRQKSRLETDRRLLRGQAESLNTRKWLPQELMDHILDLIQAEGRFSTTSLLPEGSSTGKALSEEDLTIRLWTLEQTLKSASFPEDKVKGVLQYVLEIATNIPGMVKDSIWGLEEALDWLARESTREELRDYDYRGRSVKPQTEKEFAAAKKQQEEEAKQQEDESAQQAEADSDDEIAKEAERITAEILQQDEDEDDQALADLFASLPTQEVDPDTGKTNTVINGSDGIKVYIRDFGKWTGVSPLRALEETCRSREPSAKVSYKLVSDNQHSNRHMVSIVWSKPQEGFTAPTISHIESAANPLQFVFKMVSVATPDPKQSEAYIATVALFAIFSSTKEDKVFMRLPAVWRELWSEMALEKKAQEDAIDRETVRDLRAMRIWADKATRRVSEELGEGRNDLGTSRSLVGYSIRLEANTSKETRLVYATTGIVMRMLEGSNELREITHLVLDEVHERSIDSDFLLIVLKKLLIRRQDLKVILMSATVDAEKFSKYLGGAPVLNVPGRTFPVQVKYLEDAIETTGYTLEQRNHEKMTDLDDDPADTDADPSSATEAAKELRQYSVKTRSTLSQIDEYLIEYDLVVQLIRQIANNPAYINFSKAILVFLPGIAEIRSLNDFLLGDPFFQRDWEVYPLHSTIATEDQERAFLVPPQGVRKIVLATNIAETGITIPDVTCVIDTGKHREMRFDERRQLSRLIDTFISRANAKQRRGRAGRVQEGLCFHMFTKYRHDKLLNEQQTPEMLRLSLQDLAIRVKICKIGGIEETLGDALDPPSAKNIRRAIDALVDVRALSASEELTPLGHQLARLPLDVFLGKLILQGTIFKCLDMAITVAAILSSKSPFSAPFGQRTQADQARKAFRRADSDLLTVYNAYLAWKKVCQGAGNEFQYCKKNFLSTQTLSNIEDLKGQLLVSLVDSGFLQLTEEEKRALKRLRFASSSRRGRHQQFYELPRRVNVNSDNDVISASVIAWSFYPKLLVRENRGFRNVGNNQSISLHPSSVNKGHMELKWLSYYHIMQSKQFLNAHETTAVENFAIALLCGDVRIDMYAGVIVLDGNRARFSVPDWKTALALKVLRSRLRDLLTRSFRMPGRLPTAQQEKWLDTWQRIFSQDFGGSGSGGGSAGSSDRDRERGVSVAIAGGGVGMSGGVGGGNGGGNGGTAAALVPAGGDGGVATGAKLT
ncbi:putative pre-mrna-splicing factor atp-dependent rna helicase prp22 protein [Eutypa lata UCREL1]|uniref:Putative pre-mrna-splicing factor atp-dependent rna helicase prp22 protein n=1 Tax=Eutypa lata (strain UCR-EL1) TaxID=1287681 RepID=M7TEU9_EUTLA|nr:putative pre-mrna-splicing factor atp-dependent rna helicase prp22 protein [Eutypa lata UCREL1]